MRVYDGSQDHSSLQVETLAKINRMAEEESDDVEVVDEPVLVADSFREVEIPSEDCAPKEDEFIDFDIKIIKDHLKKVRNKNSTSSPA